MEIRREQYIYIYTIIIVLLCITIYKGINAIYKDINAIYKGTNDNNYLKPVDYNNFVVTWCVCMCVFVYACARTSWCA